MIIDARTLPDDAVVRTEICIVGAGPAGISLARELVSRGRKVVLLEAGSTGYNRATDADLRGSVADGSPHAPPHMYRRRVLGGASSIWGGRCIPLDPIDFEARSWVKRSGWPIGWETLEPYYRRALAYFEAGAWAFDVQSALGADAPPTIADFDDPDIDASHVERFSPPTDFGKSNRAWLERNADVQVLTNAVALRLDAAAGPVAALQAASTPERTFGVQARRYVIAAGGIETVRLLMLSDRTRRGGLGNDGDQLGRNYMCHVEVTAGSLELMPRGRPVALHFERTAGGIYVRRKLLLSTAVQYRERLLNTAFRFHYPLIADPTHRLGILSAMYLVKDAILPEYRRKLGTIELAQRNRLRRDSRFWLAHVMNVLRDGAAVTRFGADWTRRRVLAKRKLPFVVIESRDGCYPLDVNAEQVPNPESRITLAPQLDAYGMPRPHVDWRITAQDRDSLRRSMLILRDAVERTGIGRLHAEPATLEDEIDRATPVGGHHIGSARMATAPSEGVVDPNCAVHGVPNLYVASAAVLPTCGHANPTLTVVALAMRLADHLNRDLTEQPVSSIDSLSADVRMGRIGADRPCDASTDPVPADARSAAS